MLELFPEGFEEADREDAVELAAYTYADGERRMRAAFGDVIAAGVPRDWDERWKRFHRPVRAGGVWIVPPWERAPAEPAITIDPGRAFGTGAHPTTRLCLELLSELEPASLVDVGCGSGVVAIAAAVLGYGPVAGLDWDEAALDAARRNAAANGVVLELRRADALSDPLPPTEVAVVNVNERVVGQVGARLESKLVVSSGYFEPHVPELPRYRRTRRRTLEGWAADLHARQ